MYPSFKCVWAYDSSGSDPMAVRSDKAMPAWFSWDICI